MIEFEHRLPAMNIEGRNNGTYNNEEMVLPCILTTKDSRLGQFLHRLHNSIRDDRRLVFIDGRTLVCSNNWIRDFVHELKALKHFEYDLRSFLQFILDTQSEDGFYFELIKQLDDEHWKFVNEDCRRIYVEDNVALVRLEIEADIEYLIVEGAMQVYRATGDLAWLLAQLPKLEKGIEYCTSSPKRWDKEHGLVKRAYTIDTWDITYDPNSVHDRRIHENERMCAMHGDNSGVYRAMLLLAQINDLAVKPEKAEYWRKKAQTLRENIFRYLWNGKFFVHQFPLNCEPLDEKENERLSLSNAYDINRGLTDFAQSGSIIEEYMARREKTSAFAEWFTIDPWYEKFCKEKPGTYVNGAISPFTAGELAKAALRNGYEEYGWDIIKRVTELAERDGTVYFLYSPQDSKPQGGGPSGWGAAAFISAVDEALAGVEDTSCLYETIRFSPRFAVTEYTELRYITGYEPKGKYVDVRYICTQKGMRYDVRSQTRKLQAHILLPRGKTCAKVFVNGQEIAFESVSVRDSMYVDFITEGKPLISVEILFA